MIVSKTRNAPGWATQGDNLIPNGVKCNENVIWVSVLRLMMHQPFGNGYTASIRLKVGEWKLPGCCFILKWHAFTLNLPQFFDKSVFKWK